MANCDLVDPFTISVYKRAPLMDLDDGLSCCKSASKEGAGTLRRGWVVLCSSPAFGKTIPHGTPKRDNKMANFLDYLMTALRVPYRYEY